MSDSRIKDQFIDCSGLPLEDLQSFGEHLARWQRLTNWGIGDVARNARARWPETWHQVFPEGVSPGLIQRCEAVAKAYPYEEDRNPLASWTIHMHHANKPDRIALVQAAVEKGLTSDESRKESTQNRWLLAVDSGYWLHRTWHSGAGVESAMSVAGWIRRTAERLQAKGLTDCVCCFDSTTNNRKQLTEDWPDKYKDRPPKDPELIHQLSLLQDLLRKDGLSCVSVGGMEGDDVMASYAAQFDGRVTLLTQDKDCRQCLSESVNMLLDVKWVESETSGDMLPDYQWLSAKQHTEETGISPLDWPDYQALMGDATDGIRGAEGIGQKGAADLIKTFSSAEWAIEAAKAEDERVKPKKREALIAFEPKLETTLKLVTLVNSLDVPMTTRLVGSA